jgi:ribose 5-phosphate isomerase B
MIYLGSDHGGFDLKKKIIKWLVDWGYDCEDMGNLIYEKDDDYPVYAFKVAQKVASENILSENKNLMWREQTKGILTCRSAAGMVIAANKVKGIRAVNAFDETSAKHSRLHNDTNVLAMSGDWLDEEKAKKIIQIWLNTDRSNEERHLKRVKMIGDFEQGLG